MAFRYLIYSTGTTFAETIVRESATDNPNVNEASLYSDFIIPQIQPLYLWRVTGGTTVVPNTDANINAYLESIAPPPEPQDDATVGYVTGITSTKIDKVSGATDQVPVFTADGNLEDSGYAIADLTGGTQYNFTGSGGTTVSTGSTTGGTVQITIYSATPTGTTVAWGDITGTLSDQTDLQDELDDKLDVTDFNSYTGTTETEINNKLESSVFNTYTGTSQPILDAALTRVTNLGTGTTLGLTSGRDITLKSISVLGGLSLSGDADNLIISGETNASINWGDIGGTLSNQTDLWDELTGITATTATKLDTSVFDTYTGATETRISDIEDDVTDLFNESLVNITGATNGLTKVGGKDVELGGALTKDTVISGLTHDFTINVDNITLQSVGAIDIIDANGVGGINIESDGGVIKLQGNDGTSTPVTKIEVGETTLLITDDRAIPRGIQYADDYTSTFQNRSLVDKGYVDSVATGLIPKANVLVATTADITLSGTQTIDGVALTAGDRVLVKDQTDAEDNGIYVVAAGVWSRSTDFDGNPDGEVTDGNLIPVLSGNTYGNTLWVLVTPNPITIGTTELEFTLFSSPLDLQAGVGIGITGQTIAVDGQSLAGNSISWTGNTFNVDITSGSLNTALGTKLDASDFDTFTGTTLPANYYNKTEINTYTGATDTRLEGIEDDITGLTATTAGKLDTSVFTGYTATTAANELYLLHTGGTELNTIAATAIDWDVVNVSGSSYSWTGGSDIFIEETAEYEISYNIPFVSNSQKNMAIGSNIILNNSTVLDSTASGAWVGAIGAAANVVIPTVILSLSSGDKLTLATFRTAAAGSITSWTNGSILIKKKNSLQ